MRKLQTSKVRVSVSSPLEQPAFVSRFQCWNWDQPRVCSQRETAINGISSVAINRTDQNSLFTLDLSIKVHRPNTNTRNSMNKVVDSWNFQTYPYKLQTRKGWNKTLAMFGLGIMFCIRKRLIVNPVNFIY